MHRSPTASPQPRPRNRPRRRARPDGAWSWAACWPSSRHAVRNRRRIECDDPETPAARPAAPAAAGRTGQEASAGKHERPFRSEQIADDDLALDHLGQGAVAAILHREPRPPDGRGGVTPPCHEAPVHVGLETMDDTSAATAVLEATVGKVDLGGRSSRPEAASHSDAEAASHEESAIATLGATP